MKTIDCRGQKCPQPVIQTRKAMLADPSSKLLVLVDDQACQENITRLATNMGYDVSVESKDAVNHLGLKPGATTSSVSIPKSAGGPTIITIGSELMGEGDPELGKVLMKNFIFSLTEADAAPEAIYFFNSGIKLTIKGSDVIEPLEALTNRGVDVASCGLCLEYYEAKETLAVGRISNMLELVNDLNAAGNIIKI